MLYVYNTSPSKISLTLKYEALIILRESPEPTLTFFTSYSGSRGAGVFASPIYPCAYPLGPFSVA
jgi:hypothetical protein